MIYVRTLSSNTTTFVADEISRPHCTSQLRSLCVAANGSDLSKHKKGHARREVEVDNTTD